MIFFHGILMEFLTSCLWNFCLIDRILAFSDGNSRFESGSPDRPADFFEFAISIWLKCQGRMAVSARVLVAKESIRTTALRKKFGAVNINVYT